MYRRSGRVVWRRAGDGAVLMPDGSEEVLVLSPTAAALWAALVHTTSVNELAARLGSWYRADPARIEGDIRPVLDELVAMGVVDVVAA